MDCPVDLKYNHVWVEDGTHSSATHSPVIMYQECDQGGDGVTDRDGKVERCDQQAQGCRG